MVSTYKKYAAQMVSSGLFKAEEVDATTQEVTAELQVACAGLRRAILGYFGLCRAIWGGYLELYLAMLAYSGRSVRFGAVSESELQVAIRGG